MGRRSEVERARDELVLIRERAQLSPRLLQLLREQGVSCTGEMKLVADALRDLCGEALTQLGERRSVSDG